MSEKIPKGWKWVKLGDAVIINPNETLKKGVIAKKVPMEALHPFTKKVKFFVFEKYNGGVKFKNGDTLVARITPSLENGKTVYVDLLDDDEIGFGSTEFIVLRERSGITDKQFVYYFAISNDFRDVAIKSTTGSSGRQRVQNEVVKEFEFPLPPLPEQKAIAEVLSSIDDKIDLLHRQNKTLEEMAMTLFRQWFIEPTKDGLPEGWEIGKFEENLKIVYGKNLLTSKLKDSGYPVFGGNGKIGYYTEYMYEESQVLISCRGEASGKVNISDPKSYITNNSLILERAKNKNISFEYLKYYCLNYDFTQFVTGSAQPQITIEELNNSEILIPPSILINKFSKIISNFETKIFSNKIQIQTLEKLRDTLLPKLMSGDVRIMK